MDAARRTSTSERALWVATTHNIVNAINAADLERRRADPDNCIVNVWAQHYVAAVHAGAKRKSTS